MPVAISVSKNKPSLCEAGVGAGTIRLLRYSLEQVLPLSEEPVLHRGGGNKGGLAGIPSHPVWPPHQDQTLRSADPTN